VGSSLDANATQTRCVACFGRRARLVFRVQAAMRSPVAKGGGVVCGGRGRLSPLRGGPPPFQGSNIRLLLGCKQTCPGPTLQQRPLSLQWPQHAGPGHWQCEHAALTPQLTAASCISLLYFICRVCRGSCCLSEPWRLHNEGPACFIWNASLYPYISCLLW